MVGSPSVRKDTSRLLHVASYKASASLLAAVTESVFFAEPNVFVEPTRSIASEPIPGRGDSRGTNSFGFVAAWLKTGIVQRSSRRMIFSDSSLLKRHLGRNKNHTIACHRCQPGTCSIESSSQLTSHEKHLGFPADSLYPL